MSLESRCAGYNGSLTGSVKPNHPLGHWALMNWSFIGHWSLVIYVPASIDYTVKQMPSAPRNAKAPRILIVDDDAGQRSLLNSFLTGQGFETVPVSSGEQAL